MTRQQTKFFPEFDFDAGALRLFRLKGNLYEVVVDRSRNSQPRLFVWVGDKRREIVDSIAACKVAGIDIDYSENWDTLRIIGSADDPTGKNRSAEIYKITGEELNALAEAALR